MYKQNRGSTFLHVSSFQVYTCIAYKWFYCISVLNICLEADMGYAKKKKTKKKKKQKQKTNKQKPFFIIRDVRACTF